MDNLINYLSDAMNAFEIKIINAIKTLEIWIEELFAGMLTFIGAAIGFTVFCAIVGIGLAIAIGTVRAILN